MFGTGIPAPAADGFSSAYISEFMANDQRGLRDDDGDRSGWIEFYNPGTATINLNGWHLTDDSTNLTKWRLPEVLLLPEKYLVVFASGKNRTNNLAPLHANFRLPKQGSYLALITPSKNIASEFAPTYPPQAADVSYGSVRGEPTIRGAMLRPTPGRANASSGGGFAPAAAFSRTSRTFVNPFRLELAAGNAVVIRYTLDGNLPTSHSPVYEEPLLITNTVQVRARTFQPGQLPGPPHSATYLKLHTNVLDFTSTLPVLIMDTLGKDDPATLHGSLVHLSLYEPRAGKTSLTNPPAFSTRGAFRVRGSSSAGVPQSSFALHFLDEFNAEADHSMLGLPADSDWILYAPNSFDPVLIHNPFVHQLSRSMGRYSSRTRFIEVFVVKSSGRVRDVHYNGLYILEEKIKIGKHRVDIDRLEGEDLKPPNVTGGYLLKFDRVGPGESGVPAPGPTMAYVEPKEQIITLPQRAPQRNYITGFLAEFDRALTSANWKDPVLGYPAFLDVDAAIDFHVLEVLSGNVDAMVLSTYFHKPRNGKIICGPHWDFDRALGSTDTRDENPRQWSTGPFFDGAWWPRLFRDPDFWQRWVDRWQELRGTHFSLTNLFALIDTLQNEVREAQPREYKKWGFQPRGGSFQSEIDRMKNWLSNRVDFIDGQLVERPRFGQDGGPIASGFLLNIRAATNAAVYYTLDGSDPRLPQGGISSNAILYAGSIQLKTNTLLVARARNPNQRQTAGPPSSTPWSGKITANFQVASH